MVLVKRGEMLREVSISKHQADWSGGSTPAVSNSILQPHVNVVMRNDNPPVLRVNRHGTRECISLTRYRLTYTYMRCQSPINVALMKAVSQRE